MCAFFYGDGPAAQFEAGHQQGGIYCCVGCGADSGRFSDIAYSYREPKPKLKERQEIVLQGKAWKKGGENYYRNMHTDCINMHMYMYNVHIYVYTCIIRVYLHVYKCTYTVCADSNGVYK